MNKPLIDKTIFEKYRALPRLRFSHFLKQDAESLDGVKRAFIHFGKEPVFSYTAAEAFNAAEYLQKLERFEAELPDLTSDPRIQLLYAKKIRMDMTRVKMIIAIQRKDDSSASAYSRVLFGEPAQSEADLRSEFDRMLAAAETFHVHTRPIDAELFQTMVERVLAHYNMTETWRIKMSTDAKRFSLRHGKNMRKGNIVIPASMSISKARAARLLTHEIEVHALRTHNGRMSELGILGIGGAQYLKTDEGLALHFQQQIASPRTFAPGFWNTWALTLTNEHGFTEVFQTLFEAKRSLAKRMQKPLSDSEIKDEVWHLCLRIYRGIHHPGNSGNGYYKEHIYRTGLFDVERTLEEHSEEILPFLFAGNIAIEDIETIESLQQTGTAPELVSKRIVREVLSGRNAQLT